MRNLTHYELMVLIKNEINNLVRDAHTGGLDIGYAEARAEDILRYINEYKLLKE